MVLPMSQGTAARFQVPPALDRNYNQELDEGIADHDWERVVAVACQAFVAFADSPGQRWGVFAKVSRLVHQIQGPLYYDIIRAFSYVETQGR